MLSLAGLLLAGCPAKPQPDSAQADPTDSGAAADYTEATAILTQQELATPAGKPKKDREQQRNELRAELYAPDPVELSKVPLEFVGPVWVRPEEPMLVESAG